MSLFYLYGLECLSKRFFNHSLCPSCIWLSLITQSCFLCTTKINTKYLFPSLRGSFPVSWMICVEIVLPLPPTSFRLQSFLLEGLEQFWLELAEGSSTNLKLHASTVDSSSSIIRIFQAKSILSFYDAAFRGNKKVFVPIELFFVQNEWDLVRENAPSGFFCWRLYFWFSLSTY